MTTNLELCNVLADVLGVEREVAVAHARHLYEAGGISPDPHIARVTARRTSARGRGYERRGPRRRCAPLWLYVPPLHKGRAADRC